jgi:hypothetical protein
MALHALVGCHSMHKFIRDESLWVCLWHFIRRAKRQHRATQRQEVRTVSR